MNIWDGVKFQENIFFSGLRRITGKHFAANKRNQTSLNLNPKPFFIFHHEAEGLHQTLIDEHVLQKQGLANNFPPTGV